MGTGVPGYHGQLAAPLVETPFRQEEGYATTRHLPMEDSLVLDHLVIAICVTIQNVLLVNIFALILENHSAIKKCI